MKPLPPRFPTASAAYTLRFGCAGCTDIIEVRSGKRVRLALPNRDPLEPRRKGVDVEEDEEEEEIQHPQLGRGVRKATTDALQGTL